VSKVHSLFVACEVDLPYLQVLISALVEQCSSNVFSEYASIVRCWSVCVKTHFGLVEEKVFRNSAPEVSILACPYSDYSRFSLAMTPGFAILIEKVDPVSRQKFKLERKLNLLEDFEILMKPLAGFRQSITLNNVAFVSEFDYLSFNLGLA